MPGLYVHIPFCAKKCHYCDFVVSTSSEHVDFLTALEEEMRHERETLARFEWDTLYFGGGTPSRLSAEETRRVFQCLRQSTRFAKDAEITFEVNPGDFDESKARFYRELGINRVSLGAQSFSDRALKAVNRAHNVSAIADAFHYLRRAGFSNINLDLILSLPGETIEDLHRSLEALLTLAPEHVSLYELTVEEKTVFGELNKKGKLALPSENESLEMLNTARETLKRNGYRHYELLNYAKPGFESRHNRLYWRNDEYLGLGPGAFSYIDGRRYRGSASVDEYLRKIKNGDWSALEEETLSPGKKEIEALLLALRLTEGAEESRFSNALKSLEEPIEALRGKKLLESNAGRIRLTDRGQLFAETVFSELS